MLPAMLLGLETRQECTLPTTVQHCSKVLANTIRYEKSTRGIRMGKEEVKLFIFADDMILYLHTPEKPMINLS